MTEDQARELIGQRRITKYGSEAVCRRVYLTRCVRADGLDVGEWLVMSFGTRTTPVYPIKLAEWLAMPLVGESEPESK